MSAVTLILAQIDRGDSHAAEQLLPLVYDELRKLAAAKLDREKPGQTLQATALVHEAYMRLVGGEDRKQRARHSNNVSGDELSPVSCRLSSGPWNGRGHFFAAAAEAMRRILVEAARHKQRLKHGGEYERVELESQCAVVGGPSLDLLALDEALSRLASSDSKKAELVKLRYFAGLTMPQAAEVLGISLATAERYWSFAKAWLYTELAGD